MPVQAASPPFTLEAEVSGSEVSVSGGIPRGPDADTLGREVIDALRGGLRSEMLMQLRFMKGSASLLPQ